MDESTFLWLKSDGRQGLASAFRGNEVIEQFPALESLVLLSYFRYIRIKVYDTTTSGSKHG
jgi:hypothetical protein